MIDYAGNDIKVEGCRGCAFTNHEFSIPSGIVYEDELFILSQDWKVPIPGFIVVQPNRHIENFSKLTDVERTKLFEITNKIIVILKEMNVCDKFNVLFEENPNRHFHLWIIPRQKWMEEMVGNITENIGTIFNYAETNMKTKETIDEIQRICDILKEKLKK